jgi:hypothetical protein
MAKIPDDIGPAERQSLKAGPRNMPNQPSSPPNAQINSERVTLSRTEHRVAQAGIKAGMGQIQCTSEKVALSRTENDPYDQFNATMPRSPIGKGKR